jgi:hypothetical protein
MRVNPRNLLGPLVAVVLLGLTLQQTIDALQRSGVWREQQKTLPVEQNPFSDLDAALSRRTDLLPLEDSRDPFRFAPTRTATTVRTTPRATPAPPPPPKPVLTAIIYDSDPRALVRFDGRDYTVRDNTLFSEYRVVRITREEVVLDKSGESLVLKRPTGGS